MYTDIVYLADFISEKAHKIRHEMEREDRIDGALKVLIEETLSATLDLVVELRTAQYALEK